MTGEFTLPPSPQVGAGWSTYVPSDRSPWNLKRVYHLHRRAGFGGNWSELQCDLADAPEAAVGRLLDGGEALADFPSLEKLIGDAAVSSGDINRLKAWWFFRLLFSGDPLTERMTLMWHNHFATSNAKVADVAMMKRQNDLIRQHATGKFGDLLRAVLKDAAMMVWLDAKTNRQGKPNENLARELMELFTLGEGNYSQQDVKEVARALTGWTVRGGQFAHVDAYHDHGIKRILGHQGSFDGDDVIEILLGQEATSMRIAARLCELFFGETGVADDMLEQLALGLRENELDIGWAVKTILRSEAFFNDSNIGNRVTEPVVFMVAQLRGLEMLDPPPSTLLLAQWAARLGQDLLSPPNVFGWPGGRSWLTTRTMIGRANFSAAMLGGRLHRPQREVDVAKLASKHGFETQTQRQRFLSRVLLGGDDHPGEIDQLLRLPAVHLG